MQGRKEAKRRETATKDDINCQTLSVCLSQDDHLLKRQKCHQCCQYEVYRISCAALLMSNFAATKECQNKCDKCAHWCQSRRKVALSLPIGDNLRYTAVHIDKISQRGQAASASASASSVNQVVVSVLVHQSATLAATVKSTRKSPGLIFS